MKTIRKFFSGIAFSLLASYTFSQQLSQVTFSNGANLSYISFRTNEDVLIRITDDGKMMEWGIEWLSERYNYYAPKLQPYMGRIDYYGQESDSVFRGKVRSIGTCAFTYYGHYETEAKVGKIKSVGSLTLDYYTNFENINLKGKLRFIGNIMLEYYSSFDDEAFRGKLRTVGNTPVTYYSTFDDKLIRGKIKTIGSAAYTWYTSFELRNGMKSGSYRQNIGGVTYILQ